MELHVRVQIDYLAVHDESSEAANKPVFHNFLVVYVAPESCINTSNECLSKVILFMEVEGMPT